MPHPTRLNMREFQRRAIEKVLVPAATIFDQQQVLLSCGHTLWVSGNKKGTAHCTLCPMHRSPNQRGYFR